MVYFSLSDSLQFYSWRFYCNTSFAPVSFTDNRLLKNFLNKNRLLLLSIDIGQKDSYDARDNVCHIVAVLSLWKAN